MSPVGDPFRNRLRQYPAFVNCTTIDWFSEWPKDALLEVAEKYLEDISLGGKTSNEVDQVNVCYMMTLEMEGKKERKKERKTDT